MLAVTVLFVGSDRVENALPLSIDLIERLPGLFKALRIALAGEEGCFACRHNLVEAPQSLTIASKLLVTGDRWLFIAHTYLPRSAVGRAAECRLIAGAEESCAHSLIVFQYTRPRAHPASHKAARSRVRTWPSLTVAAPSPTCYSNFWPLSHHPAVAPEQFATTKTRNLRIAAKTATASTGLAAGLQPANLHTPIPLPLVAPASPCGPFPPREGSRGLGPRRPSCIPVSLSLYSHHEYSMNEYL